MSKKAPRVLIILGIALLVLAGGLKAYSMLEDYQSGQRAQRVLEQMRASARPADSESAAIEADVKSDPDQSENILPEPVEPAQTEPIKSIQSEQAAPTQTETTAPAPTEQTEAPEPAPPEQTKAPVPASPAQVYYDTVGVLTIARLGLELPVLSQCSDSLLKVSVCRYMGDALVKPERLVVAGHNYKSHFGSLSKLVSGDEVCFTSLDGINYRYTVVETTEISSDDNKALWQGEWDITLFTCNFDGKRRILVRCQEEQSTTGYDGGFDME